MYLRVTEASLFGSIYVILTIDVVEKSVKDIIKDEVKSQLPRILSKEVSDFATPVIQSTINELLENVVLAKSSSQPKSTYEAAALLTEFEFKKILLDKIEKSKSYQVAPEHRELYDGLVKSYNLNKDIFSSYGNVYSLKRDREDEDKDKDPPAGSNQGLKKQKTSKVVEPSRYSKSKEFKSSSSKGSKSNSKSSGKSAQAEEPVFETAGTKMTQDQGDDIGAASGLRPYHFTYPKRRLTMEEMLNKFIDEGKREHEKMRAFICLEVYKVVIGDHNTPRQIAKIQGVTTRGGKPADRPLKMMNAIELDELDDTINTEAQELLANDMSDSFLLKGLEKLIDQSDLESCKSLENNSNNESLCLGIPIWRINSVNTSYSVEQRTARLDGVKSEHLYSA
ncbi:hypothetical protein Tco_0906638 [Tanacetum coccineum]|uniref:Uncharacterized protein n=1 Tax=Tanacetum coccineum TaxID=301880 RepID=A0ABQ5CI08_9ASTR